MVIDESKYQKTVHPDGRIEFVPIKSTRERPVDGYAVSIRGGTMPATFPATYEHFNIFPTEEAAEKHSKLQRRFNAIGLACALVDPDFELDRDYPNQDRRTVIRRDREWQPVATCGWADLGLPCVSSREKADEVIALLKEWGVE